MAEVHLVGTDYHNLKDVAIEVPLDEIKSIKARARWRKIKHRAVPMVLAHRAFKDAISVPSTLRFKQALVGPEMEELKKGEFTIFPDNEKWPFLLRFPVNTVGICVGLSSQAVLWRKLSKDKSMQWASIPIEISYALWYMTVSMLVAYSIVYAVKAYHYLAIVQREWKHVVRNNFFYAPFLVACSLATAVPDHIAKDIHPSVFVIFAVPIFLLDIHIFGEWFCGDNKKLCEVANPTTYLAVSTNFICSNLGAVVGWKEPAKFFFFIGFAHYVTVFVTLYQSLPNMSKLPANMHPVAFMFLSPSSAGGLAWLKISGSFNDVVQGFFWLTIFLYASLIVRVHDFWSIKFTLSWWAYTFPMTLVAVFSIQYANRFVNDFTKAVSVILSIISVITVFYVSFRTAKRFFNHKLFPNDIAVAITDE